MVADEGRRNGRVRFWGPVVGVRGVSRRRKMGMECWKGKGMGAECGLGLEAEGWEVGCDIEGWVVW